MRGTPHFPRSWYLCGSRYWEAPAAKHLTTCHNANLCTEICKPLSVFTSQFSGEAMAYLDFLKGSRIKLKTSQFIHVSLGLLNVTTDIW